MRFPLAVFAMSRVAIVLLSHWGLRIDPRLHRGAAILDHPGVDSLCWWDCGWFVRIAQLGYQDPLWSNFFPLFPLLGRWLHQLTGMPLPYALVLWANLFGAAGLVVTYRLFEALEGESVARTGVALLAAWPFSFFHATGYPESLMFLTSVTAIYLALRGRHLWAGVVLGVGILGRHLTVVAGLSLLVMQLLERGRKPLRFVFHPAFLGLVLPFVVAGTYSVFLAYRFGDPLAFLHARSEGWGEGAWYGLGQYFSDTSRWEPQIHAYVVLSAIPGVGALALLSRRQWWGLAGFGVGLMIALWCIGLLGLGRYTQACWPAFLPMAYLLEKYPDFRTPVITAFAMLQGLFLFLFTHSYPIN
ncbi:glycosyltransferase family 39 protein [Hyalangium rubrum]|nr:glycosyltransferase family 39 protein [Hyalangium sp. s54d21]